MNYPVINTNAGEVQLSGMFTLTAAGAVNAVVSGDVAPVTTFVTKTGTGTYQVTFSRARIDGFRAAKVLFADARFYGTTAPAGAVNSRVSSVVNAANGDIQLNIVLSNATHVPTDTTAAVSICYQLRFKNIP